MRRRCLIGARRVVENGATVRLSIGPCDFSLPPYRRADYRGDTCDPWPRRDPRTDLEAPEALARRAGEITEQVVRHFARLIGDIGVRALFKRSVVLVGLDFPWLASPAGQPAPPAAPYVAMCAAMAGQPVDVALAGLVAVHATFASLLGRLIGEPLVRRLLHEIWPAQFEREKESE